MAVEKATSPTDLNTVFIVTQGNPKDTYVTVIAQCINRHCAGKLVEALSVDSPHLGFDGPVKPSRYPVSMRFNNA